MSTSNAVIGIPLFNAKAVDATELSNEQRGALYPRAGKFQLLPTPKGGFALVGESPRGPGDAKTSTAILPVTIPSNYIPGGTLEVILSSAVVAVTPGQNLTPASTINISVSRVNTDGSITAIPVTTAAQSLTTVGTSNPTYSQQTFNIDGTDVNPGDVLLISVQTSLAVGQAISTSAMICSAQLVAAVQNYAMD